MSTVDRRQVGDGARVRIGAVSYLNTRPLVYRMTELAPEVDLRFDVPSRLADQLAAGTLDVALIPSIEYFLDPNYVVVSDACIGCRGPVLSVKLWSRVPVDRIRSLALDEGSRTSAALVQVLLDRRYRLRPRLQSLPLGMLAEEVDADAVLLIGDRAMHPPRGTFAAVWDLGEEWCRETGLPFVFAMWVARETPSEHTSMDRPLSLSRGTIDRILRQSRDLGVAHLEAIAAQEAPTVGLDATTCLVYLRDSLYFYLGAAERRGLTQFQQEAARIGLIPGDSVLRFDQAMSAEHR